MAAVELLHGSVDTFASQQCHAANNPHNTPLFAILCNPYENIIKSMHKFSNESLIANTNTALLICLCAWELWVTELWTSPITQFWSCEPCCFFPLPQTAVLRFQQNQLAQVIGVESFKNVSISWTRTTRWRSVGVARKVAFHTLTTLESTGLKANT